MSVTFSPSAMQELAARWRVATEKMILRHYGADPEIREAARAQVRMWLTDPYSHDDVWLAGYELGLRHARNEVRCSGPGSDQCLSSR